MRDFKKYDVWVTTHELVLFVYKEIIPRLPSFEKFELVSQIRRAACSIPLNIAEGCGRNTDKDFVNFLDTSLGSAHELEYCGILIFDLGWVEESLFRQMNERVNLVKAQLIKLIKAIRK